MHGHVCSIPQELSQDISPSPSPLGTPSPSLAIHSRHSLDFPSQTRTSLFRCVFLPSFLGISTTSDTPRPPFSLSLLLLLSLISSVTDSTARRGREGPAGRGMYHHAYLPRIVALVSGWLMHDHSYSASAAGVIWLPSLGCGMRHACAQASEFA